MAMPNIFTGAAFDAITLTDRVNQRPVQPTLIGQLGVFEEEGIATTQVQIDFDANVLSLVPNTDRSAPNRQLRKNGRLTRDFRTSHFPLETTIMATEIQDQRASGGVNLERLEYLLDKRTGEISRSLDVTLEYQRLGAIKGVITDADGTSVIYNLFTEFGLTRPSLAFTFSAATTVIGNLCRQLQRLIYDAVGDGVPAGKVMVLAGREWFEAFIEHPNVKEKYLNYQNAIKLANMSFMTPFEYGGVMIQEYFGTVSGVPFVAANEAHAFPVGVPGLFKTVFAPADMIQFANTTGLPRYANSERMEFDKGVKIMGESNPFSYCARPLALVRCTMN